MIQSSFPETIQIPGTEIPAIPTNDYDDDNIPEIDTEVFPDELPTTSTESEAT